MPAQIDPDTKMCNCAVCHCELVGATNQTGGIVGRKTVAGHRTVPVEGGGVHVEPLCSRCAKLEKKAKSRTPNVGGRRL